MLALDIGQERVGVAVSDPLGLTAQPLPTLNRHPEPRFLDQLATLLESLEVSEVAVGLPRGLSGARGTHQEEIEKLVSSYQERWKNIKWILWDERFTTQAAIRTLQNAPSKKRKQKGLRDRIAAQLILEGYLQSRDRRPTPPPPRNAK